jgi:signal transduction histidine kinase
MKRTDAYRLALTGSILIALLNVWLASHALHTLLQAQQWEAHTLEIISHTQALVAKLRSAESAARGYILTADPKFDQQYIQDSSQLNDEIASIGALTADNRSQQSRIPELRRRVAAKLSALDAGIDVRRGHPSGMLDPAELGPVINDTPDRAASVQAVIHDIEVEEQRLLSERTAQTDVARHQVWVSLTAAFSLDLILLVVAFRFLLRLQRDKEVLAGNAEEIRHLNTELQGLNTSLEARVEQRTRELALSNQELEAFSYSVSHDLRAPLRTIDGFSLALMEDFSDKLNDEGRDYLGRVRGGVQRMGSLIDALLQLSRVTRSDVQRERLDLSQLATLVFNELMAADPDRKIHFTAQPDIMAQADPRLMRIAFENLLGNAIKFTSKVPEARIEFGSSIERGRTVYFVRDNGAGFDMTYVDRLFTAFQRLHGDRDFKGSGIGLATVSRIVRRHDGDIWASSELDHGATFFFTLGI